MSLIPPELLLAQNKREVAARKAGDSALLGKISTLSDEIAATIVSIKAQTKTVREIKNEFVASLGEVSARVYSLETVAISDKAAIIEQINSISVSVGNAANLALAAQASIDEFKTVAAAEGVAITDQVVRLQSRVGDNSASITEEKITRATADEALASLITTVTADYIAADAVIAASVTAETTARSTADAALASSITSVIASYTAADSTLTAAITSESTSRASADSAEASTRASADASLSTSIGVVSAAVTTETSARIAADGAIHAMWGVAINVNGSVVGRIHLDGTGTTSEFSVEATKFTVWNGTSNVAPFQVVGGVVRVAALSIVSTDVSGLATVATTGNFDDITGAHKPANNADVTLTAINGGLVITSGGITLNGTPSIKSNNYVAGVSGWIIDGSGNAEFQNATIRGTLNAGDLLVGTVPTGRLPAGIGAPLGTAGGAGTVNSGSGPQAIAALQVTATSDGQTRVIAFSGSVINSSGVTNTLTVSINRGGAISTSEPILLTSGQTYNLTLLADEAPVAGSYTWQMYISGTAASGNNMTLSGRLIVQ